MPKWYLVRHGATAWAAEGRLQGHADTRLTDEGREQVALLARRLAQVGFNAAYCSDLSRTRDTAKALLGARPIAVQELAELREIRHLSWQGMTYPEIEQRFPEEYRLFMGGDMRTKPGGGESLAELLARLARAKEMLWERAPREGNILIVSHGGALRALLLALLGLPPSAYWQFRVSAAGLSVVDMHDGVGSIERWNDVSHLETSPILGASPYPSFNRGGGKSA